MDFINFSSKFNFIKGLITFLVFALLSSISYAAYIPLEIIQPQPNLDTKNRFYKAYPGLEYNVRLAVAGGAFPFQFSLTSAPQGMTIDKRGEITWPNPVASDTPYQVAVSVIDSEATTRSVSWTITVTTDGFLFVDAVNGKAATDGGAGTISNPWKSMKDVYGGDVYDSKWSTHQPGAFVYWRNGVYNLDAYIENDGAEPRVPWTVKQPVVWLAYPGETPEINFNSGGKDAYLKFYGDTNNLYLDGFDFNINNNSRGKGVSIGNGGNVTIRNNIFRGLTSCQQGGNNAQLFFSGGMGQYASVQDNVARESCGYWLLGYDSPKTVVENNFITGDMPKSISPKDNIQHWTIRGNDIEGSTTSGSIYIQEYGYSNNIEISFNVFKMSPNNGMALNLLSSDPSGPVYVHRNTIIGHVLLKKLTTNMGPWTITDNVIINNSPSPDKMTYDRVEDYSRLVASNNLFGNTPDNIVDAQGYLTLNYSKYVGTHGHQIGKRPMPPMTLNIQK